MIKNNKFLLIFFSILVIVFVSLYSFNIISKAYFFVFVLVLSLNLINSTFALFLFNRSFKKGNQAFLINVLGGMGARMFFLLISIIIILKFLNIDKYQFIFTFFISYFFLLTYEIFYYTKKINNTIK
ncbi:MAG: hypothetical protein V1773_03195 [bacterium]